LCFLRWVCELIVTGACIAQTLFEAVVHARARHLPRVVRPRPDVRGPGVRGFQSGDRPRLLRLVRITLILLLLLVCVLFTHCARTQGLRITISSAWPRATGTASSSAWCTTSRRTPRKPMALVCCRHLASCRTHARSIRSPETESKLQFGL
jgi:predicted small secreted protein